MFSNLLTGKQPLTKILILTAISLSLVLTSYTPAQAATSFAFGYDLARQLDRNQDDGQANFSFQFASGRRSALVAEVAKGDSYTAFELGFKRYNEKFLSGTYFQLGLDYWLADKEKKPAESKFGIDVRTGYELALSKNLVGFGAVSLVYGPNNTLTHEEKEFLFRPHLGLKWHF